uniref:RNA-directed RNA polymerase L n=1 Tax=Hymenopteran almendra-related virus OKIAV1 TaxID=2746366 RepID=A0A7D7F3D3_9RHAB|nr:RNA-dependent RNA polymerase [Hymenopteran almendra-related virus OKIAV1]
MDSLFEDNLDEINYDINEEDQYEDGELTGDVILQNNDYSLDSPLNNQLKINILENLILGYLPKCYEGKTNKNTKKWKRIIDKEGIHLGKKNLSDLGIHKRIIDMVGEDMPRTMRKSISLEKNEKKKIMIAIESILKCVSREEFDTKEKETINNVLGLLEGSDFEELYMNNLFQSWLEFDFLIKIRNKKNTGIDITKEGSIFKAPEDMGDYFKVNIEKQKTKGRRKTQFLEEWIVCEDLYYSRSLNFFMTHEEMLMIKDICFGRMISMLILHLNLSNNYSSDILEKVKEIYKMGDLILKETGNDGYDLIKLIEPLCVLQWLKIAEDDIFKSLIDPFEGYLNKELNKTDIGYSLMASINNVIKTVKNKKDVGVIFGSFRHWGHPYIESEVGLKKIKDLVREEIKVDENYARQLASDLARICLSDHYRKTGKWGVDKSKVKESHALYKFIQDDMWPTSDVLRNDEILWNELPLTQIYDVPDDISLSSVYSDKSHSCGRKELFESWSKDRKNPIRSKKVLETLLKSETVKPKSFLNRIDEFGISVDELIIGLKDKERELKKNGRFFTLMSWEIREYIVLTEYLIKRFFLPHFSGITMADGLTTLTKKIIKLTQGQSGEIRNLISIANHVDFEKWNNLQRDESVKYVFSVMDRLLGFNKGGVISRTHKIFQDVLVYFPSRPDLFVLKKEKNNKISVDESKSNAGWNGQAGGFEGVRQKGWTVVGALLVLREAKKGNVKVNLLAQGDNQIIVTNFKIPRGIFDNKEDNAINIMRVNTKILENFYRGVQKLGLRINKDETYSSTRFLVYGKVPVLSGMFINLETKKWSRASAISNDQVPTSGNIMGSISTTAISSQQYESGNKGSITLYSLISLLCLILSIKQNPLIASQEVGITVRKFIYWAFFDRSIGGYTGTSGTRFLIRQFPDPITESLSFWRRLHQLPIFKDLAELAYHPQFSNKRDIWKLVEDPQSLNIISGSNLEQVLKGEVRKSLIKERGSIKNRIIRGALEYSELSRKPMEIFLESINPCFPRFLSEFVAGTELGLADGTVGLIQNSRTMRNLFRKNFALHSSNVILRHEAKVVTRLQDIEDYRSERHLKTLICASKRADELRRSSWRRELIGSTVPHPFDYLEYSNSPSDDCVSVGLVSGLRELDSRGPLKPYLGSKTSETTSVINRWDKVIEDPLSIKAFKLLRSIDWFVDRNTKLSSSILNNIFKLTGEKITPSSTIIKRTGTPIHRFSTSRVSNGGFIAHSPNLVTWMYVTSETLTEIKKENYDFMYQASMLLAQSWTTSRIISNYVQPVYSYNWSCRDCLRKVEDGLRLNSNVEYNPMYYHKVYGVSGCVSVSVKEVYDNLSRLIKSRCIQWDGQQLGYQSGINIGLIFSGSVLSAISEDQEASMFPLGIRDKIYPREFFNGLIDGMRIGSYASLFKRYRKGGEIDPRIIIYGTVNFMIQRLAQNESAMSFFDGECFKNEIIKLSKIIPRSFPTTIEEMSVLLEKALRKVIIGRKLEESWNSIKKNGIILFHESCFDSNIVLIQSFIMTASILTEQGQKSRFNSLIWKMKGPFLESLSQEPIYDVSISPLISKVEEELRSAFKDLTRAHEPDGELLWEEECKFPCQVIDLYSNPIPGNIILEYNRVKNPIMRLLRFNDVPTSSHYKVRSMVNNLNIVPNKIVMLGDGSGGCGAGLLRYYKGLGEEPKIIHNSLLEKFDLSGGTRPPIPSAYLSLNEEDRNRCMNLRDYWKFPSDLKDRNTWDYINNFIEKNDTVLIINESEPRTASERESIISTFNKHYKREKTHVIWKCYVDDVSIINYKNLINEGSKIIRSDCCSYGTGEFYIYSRLQSNVLNKKRNYISDKTTFDLISLINKENTIERKIMMIKSFSLEITSSGIPKELVIDRDVQFEYELLKSGIKSDKIIDLRHTRDYKSIITNLKRSLLNDNKLENEEMKNKLIPSSGNLKNYFSWILGMLLNSAISNPEPGIIKKIDQISLTGMEIRFMLRSRGNGRWVMKIRDRGEKLLGVSFEDLKDRGVWISKILWASKPKFDFKSMEIFQTSGVKVVKRGMTYYRSDREIEPILLNMEDEDNMEGELR